MSGFTYPLLLEPILVPRPWGGGRLCKLYDRPCVDSEQPIGESWDVSTWPQDPGNPGLATVTKITNGPLAGTLLDQVVSVPVVVKLLDSAEKLSVQAHPVTKEVHKDEMWYILHADPGAYLFCGLKQGVDKKAFCDLIHSSDPSESDVLAMLNRADNVRPGMHYNVPTGTVHAVGPGLVAFEISEQTQVTYRLFDYNRGRALHLDDGCVAVMAQRPDLPALDQGLDVAAERVETLTEFPTFCVVKAVGERVTIRSSKHMHLVTATMGDCALSGPSPDWSVVLRRSYTCLVPATATAYTIDADGGEVLISPLKGPTS
ncbi:MAG: class I mannose-6-phosphate isomerase [Armatimonadetes bacterium]|nr:class I mannose-6-phosphate isomerase [Armatimonadota bacterium]